jgi:GST-like protein
MVGDYSIADMATYPWMAGAVRLGFPIDEFPEVKRWLAAIAARPATVRAYEKGKALSSGPPTTEEARKVLFGQSAETLKNARS